MNANTYEKKELLDLVIYAFNKPRTKEREAALSKLLEFSTAYTHREQEQLTSMVIDNHFEVYWNDAQVKMAGIGYVASYPEYRGNGAIRKIMTQILRDNYEKGTIFSYLAPFSYEFYEKFGYHYAFDRKIYTIPSIHFPKGKRTSGEIVRQSLSETSTDQLWEKLNAIHKKAYNQGSLARTKNNWDYYFLHKAHPQLALYRENGEDLGYLLYEFSEKTFQIIEFISLSMPAKEAFYRFISSHAGQFEEIQWVAPTDALLEQDMSEPAYANIQLLPYMQARIVNLSAFLEINGQPNFAAEITDEMIPENNMTIGEGQPEKMTIGAFTARILRENKAILREYF